MGKVVKRLRKCNICKASYPSFSKEFRSNFSQRTHRSKNTKCLEVQGRLKELHEKAGNTGDLVFIDDDEEADFEINGMSDGGELYFELDEGQSQQSDDVGDDVPENAEERKKEDSDFEMEDDFEEEKDIDDNDSEADSVDSYDRSKKLENLMYDASEVMELDNCAEGNEGIVQFDFEVAEEKKNPRDKSFWNDPYVDLIGKKIIKNFGIQGVYVAVIIFMEESIFQSALY